MKLSFLSFAAVHLIGQGHAAKTQPHVHLDAAVESDDKPYPNVLDLVKSVQKGSEVKHLRVGAAIMEEQKRKKKGGKKRSGKKKSGKKKRGGKKKSSKGATSPDEDKEFSAVYTMTNDPDGNSILIYSRNIADGTLTFQGHVPTGGNGARLEDTPVSQIASQDSVAVFKDCLFAVNAGSGSISSFFIESEDTIYHVGTYPTGGKFPVSITERAGFLYVLNAGGSGSFKGFTLADNCELAGNTNDVNLQQGDVSPANPPSGLASPAEINFTRDGSLIILIKAEGGGQNLELGVSGVGSINHYTVDRKGRVNQGSLTKTLLSDFPGSSPFALDFDNEDRLKVVHAATGDVTEWEVNADGSFTQVNTVNTGQAASCWIRFNTKNKCVYTSNTASSSITSLSAAPGFDYQLTESAAFSNIATPLDLISSTDGENLYVLSSGVGDPSGFPGIYVFSAGSDCGLTQLPTIRDGFGPVADQVGAAMGIAVFPGNSWGLVE